MLGTGSSRHCVEMHNIVKFIDLLCKERLAAPVLCGYPVGSRASPAGFFLIATHACETMEHR